MNVKPVRLRGVLECDACNRAIPYADYEDSDMATWPEHRCPAAPRGTSTARPAVRFTRFVVGGTPRPRLPHP